VISCGGGNHVPAHGDVSWAGKCALAYEHLLQVQN
jgi:hypothetical protein